MLQRLDFSALAFLSSSSHHFPLLSFCLSVCRSLCFSCTASSLPAQTLGARMQGMHSAYGNRSTASCLARAGTSQPAGPLASVVHFPCRLGQVPRLCSVPVCYSTFLCRSQHHGGGKSQYDPGVSAASSVPSRPVTMSFTRLEHRCDF